MRIFKFILFLSCLSLSVKAGTVDSLRQVIPSLSYDERSKAYLQLSQLLSSGDDVQAMLDCTNEWIAYEQEQGHVDDEDKARWSRIAVFTNCALDSMLLSEAPKEMEWFAHRGYWNHYYDTWDSKASVYLYSGRIQTALREAHQMLDDAQSRDNSYGRSVAYQLMGVVYEGMGQYSQAAEVFRKCVAQLKENDGRVEVLTTVYDYLCQTLDASHDYEGVLSIANEWEQCVLHRLSQKSTLPEMHYATYIACLCNKTSALVGLKRLDEAQQALLKASQLQSKSGTPLGQYRIYYTHIRWALAAGKPQEALLYTDSIQNLELNAGGDILFMRGEALQMMGRFKEAADIFHNLYLAKDSTYTREMRLQLDELNTLYKVDELKIQSQLQRSHFWMGIAVLIVFALLLFIFLRHRAAVRLRREHTLLQESNEKLEQSYHQLQVANSRAGESSKMKSLFIRQVSHEIRTPLNILSGFTQVITSSGMKLDEATKADIHARIIESTDRITGLVNKMLELSDASSQAIIECKDDVNASQIALQASQDARMTQARHITFVQQTEQGADDVLLHTNLKQATRALALLLDNAQKFTKEGGVVLCVSRCDDKLQFIVEDTGIGVPAGEAERIFEEFVQLDGYYEGTGIGLTVARSIARRLGGDVVLDTTYQRGARFVMTLPTIDNTNTQKMNANDQPVGTSM